MHSNSSSMGREIRKAALLGAFCLCSAGSCLLLTNRDKNQCATTTDCASKGSAFAGTQCIAGVCVGPDAGVGPDSGSPPVGECATTAECLANASKPNTYCSADKQCLPMTSDDCTSIVTPDGKPITPDAIILGLLAPLSGGSASDGTARVRAATLAYQEFIGRQVGIPTGPGTKPRPVAMVACDQTVDAVRAATHLATHVGVPAIIGPGFSGTTVKVAMNVTIPSGVLLFTPSATTPDLTTMQDNGLVWRTSSSFTPESKAYADLLAQMENNADLRASLGLAAGAPIKVAVLAKGDSYGKGLADLLLTTLRFNGTDVSGNGTARFGRYDFPDLSANPNADVSGAITGITTGLRPNIIMLIGTAEVLTKGLVSIENQWPTGTDSPPRPYYVVSEGAKLAELISAVGQSASTHPDQKLAKRVQVFGPRYNDTLYNQLQTRYKASFNEPLPDVYGVTGSYDAFYLLAYAMLATQSAASPTGATIATGLARTVAPGLTISAGPSDLSKGAAELALGKNIDYDGVTGPLDFDVSTGECPGDYNLYCVQADGFHTTGQYYRSTAAELVGTYAPCP
jgi:ABC-type branched-subunit amino acid transport system substrate-binding protein